MSEESLERSRKTLENARDAADEAREAEPFRAADENPPPETSDSGTDSETAGSADEASKDPHVSGSGGCA